MRKQQLVALSVICMMLVPAMAFGAIKLQKSRFGEKGKFHIGGQILGWSSMTNEVEGDETGTTTNFTIQPTVGYFVMPGLEIGGMIDYTSESTDPKAGGDTEGKSAFSLGPEVAYYYKVSPILHVYGRGYFTFLLSSSTDPDDKADRSGNTWAVGAGVAIPIGHKVGGVFNIGVDYVTKTLNYTPDGGSESEIKDSGPALATGISLYF